VCTYKYPEEYLCLLLVLHATGFTYVGLGFNTCCVQNVVCHFGETVLLKPAYFLIHPTLPTLIGLPVVAGGKECRWKRPLIVSHSVFRPRGRGFLPFLGGPERTNGVLPLTVFFGRTVFLKNVLLEKGEILDLHPGGVTVPQRLSVLLVCVQPC